MPGTGSLVVAGDRLYAITEYHLHLLSLANPAHPAEIGSTIASIPADLAVEGSLVFLASGYLGLKIVDASDPANIHDLGSVQFGPNARFVAVSGTHAYVSTNHGGIFVVDVADPSSPVIVSQFDTVQLTWDLDAIGSVVYVADWAGSLQVEDVSDPAAPRILGRVDASSYIAMGALAHGDRIYVAGYSDGLQIVAAQCDQTRPSAQMPYNAPPKLEAFACSPNPFNPRTTIKFTIPQAGRVSLVVYDLRGRQVAPFWRKRSSVASTASTGRVWTKWATRCPRERISAG